MADQIPHFDVTIDPENLKEGIGPVLAVIRPKWSIENLKFSTSTLDAARGVINSMIRCYVDEDKNNAIMIRIKNSKLDDIFNNTNELKALKYYQALHCAPELLATFKNGLCYKFIPGEVLDGKKLRQEDIWRAIAEELALFHTGTYSDDTISEVAGREAYRTFVDWCLNNYPTELKKEDPQVNERFLKEFPSKETMEQEYLQILKHVEDTASPVLLCHSDLKPENIVWNSDTGKVHFVDFETVNYRPQAFEISFHFMRFAGINSPDFSLCPDDNFQRKWLQVYLRKYYELTGRKQNGVTDVDIERLLIQVKKYNLLVLIELAYLGVALWAMDNTAEYGSLDGESIAANSLKQYWATKDSTLALKLPN